MLGIKKRSEPITSTATTTATATTTRDPVVKLMSTSAENQTSAEKIEPSTEVTVSLARTSDVKPLTRCEDVRNHMDRASEVCSLKLKEIDKCLDHGRITVDQLSGGQFWQDYAFH